MFIKELKEILFVNLDAVNWTHSQSDRNCSLVLLYGKKLKRSHSVMCYEVTNVSEDIKVISAAT